MQKFTGKQYLQIDIANHFGLDKKDWSERLAWFQTNEGNLEGLTKQAETPDMYYAAVQAYRDVQLGKSSGFPISLDATSSGLQILACLTGDRKAAELCNVVNVGHRADAYTGIYRGMLDAVGETAKIKREDTKQAIMTALYGSTAMPKQVFGDGPLLRVFEDTMEKSAPAVWELNKKMPLLWNPEGLSHDWVMPDNFHVHVKVIDVDVKTVNFLNEPFDIFFKTNRPTPTGRSLGANTVHSIDGMIVREMVRRCMHDAERIAQLKEELKGDVSSRLDNDHDHMVVRLWAHYEASGYLSARILDHISMYNAGHVELAVVLDLIDSLPAKPFQLMTIHDCFRCLPNYGNDLRQQYTLQLHLIAKSNMLSYMVSQILGRQVTLGKLDKTLADDILDTDYALS